MDYIAQPKDYWIALNAINITLNALGDPNRTQGSVASGAAILCYIEGVAGLGYDNGHRFRTWPLSISPTKFNSNTAKYVYVAIPRTAEVGTQAVVVFPSEKLDIYGVNANDEQLGSTDYYYIWLQGIITATDGTSIREWAPRMNFGQKGTDEDLYDDTSSEWYQYSKVSEVVTFLKNIAMKAGTTFQNLILGYKELTGVATSDITYTDSDVLVATPGYIESQYLSKTHESTAQEQIGFLKGLWVGVRSLYEITANGIAKLKSVIAEDVSSQRVQTGEIKSPNYTGDGVADTGFRLTNSHNGHSKLTIDELYVRMKAVFESLEVRERTYTGGDQIWSCAGNRIIRVDYLGNVETADHVPQMMRVHSNGQPASQEEQDDVYSVPVPGDTYGYSDVKVPWLLRQMPLLARAKVFARYRKVRIVINEPSASGARRAAAESPLANIRRARCYFLAKDDDTEVNNWWRINDLARCQTMNLANTTRQTYLSGEDQKTGNIFWWRKVIGVSYEPVTLDDGKQYHYFDVSFDYEYEQSHPEVMATSVMEGSDIPAAQDSVVQFGNTIIEGRMNLMMMEVNGSDAVGYNPTTDAPCLKAYRGIYCFDLNKSWVGGNACKMKLSPKSGYEFYGPNFKQVTEYDVVPVPVDRGLWTDITPTRDDYREHAMVRKCYYYDKVSHNGSYWLCSIVDGTHWVDSSGNYISDADYSALSEEQKALCSRKQNYTIEEPSEDSIDWTLLVEKGSSGTSGDTPAMLFTSVAHGTTPTAPVCTAANYMADTLPQGWMKNAPNRATGYDVWMSQNTVTIDANGDYALKNVNWSTPTRISGDKGEPGADADDREWIYIGDTEYRSTYADATHTHPDSISQGEVSPSGTASGSDANKQQDDWVPNGWSDTAIATNDTTHKFVYVSWRDKDRTTGTWGSFQDPILWSNWGVQGTDGDGVQYVFKLYADKLTSAQEESFKPTRGTQDASGEWSANNSTADTQSGSWQDDAPSATENLPYCYCSVIKRLNSTWGNFETLGLWSRFSKDGESQPDYTQTQEAWSNDETTASVYTAPATDDTAAAGQPGSAGYPKDADWHDTTPANTNSYAYLWRRSRKMVLQDDGSYAPETDGQGNLTTDGQWSYSRLTGANGTSIKTKGSIAVVIAAAGTWPTTGVTANDLGIKQGDATIWKFNGTTWVETATESADGDSYTVSRDCIIDLDGDGMSNNIKGHLLLWSDEAAKWIDLGQFKGDAGTTYYTHVAWGKDVTLSASTLPIPAGQTNRPNASDVPYFSVSPLEGYKWMGILINTTPEDPTSSDKLNYTWQNTEGPQGPQGGRTGTVYLYKRSATAISTVGIASTLYYKFSTKKLYTDSSCTTEVTTQLNGWSLTIPAGTDPIYVTAAIAYSETESDDIGSNEWVTPALFTGEHGINSATIFLYKRSASVPTGAAATPSQTLYYKFADGLLYTTSSLTTAATTELNGWSLSMPATDGNPCYIIQAAALSTESYDPIATTDWSGVRKALEDGKGQPDYIQTQEAWSNVESVASETIEPTPNGGWSDTTPANTNNYAYLWRRSRKMVLQSDGTYAAATGSDGQWKYARLSGTNGTSIKTKGTIAVAITAAGTWPTTGVTANDLGIKQGDATIWKFNGTTWVETSTESADGDSYTVSRDCIIDLDGDGTSNNIKGHLLLWSEEANGGNGAWIDLGEFKGDAGTTYYTHVAWASDVTIGTTPSGHTTTGQTTTPNATAATGFSVAPFDGAAWVGVLINTETSDSSDALSYTWNKVEGPQGDSITKTSETSDYQVSDNGATTPSGTWYSTKQAAIDAYNTAHGISGHDWQPDTFMWTRTTITWSDNSTTVLYGAERNPNDGATGMSIVIASQNIDYCRRTAQQGQADPSTLTYGAYPSTLNEGDWLYTRTTIVYETSGGAAAGTTVSYSVSRIGVDGAPGKDGWMITANPANVIIIQALGNNTTQFSTVKVGFTAKKGSVSATVSSLAVPTGQQALSNEFNAVIGTGDDAKKVIVSSPKTYTPQGGTAQYYTEGTFVVDVIVTDPDTGSSVTFNVTVPCYADLLGAWKETVETDVKHEVATSKFYFEDENGNVVAYETIGDFIKSSTENTSVLTKKVNEGKNLLTLTSGWEGFGGAAVNYDKKNFGVWDTNSDLYSPFIRLAEGQSVCFSAYMSSDAAQSGNWYIGYGSTPPVHLSDLYDNAYISIALIPKSGDSITVDGMTYNRYYYVLNASSVFADQYITFNLANPYKLFCPQLENGDAPTAFTASSVETSSQIHQTAGEIELSIKEGLDNTGIHISTGRVEVEAENFTVGKNGNQVFGVDSGTGLVTMQDVDIKGSLMYHKTYIDKNSNNNYIQMFQMYNANGIAVDLDDSGEVKKTVMLYDTLVIGEAERNASYPLFNSIFETGYTIILPPAKLFPGMRIKIINGTVSFPSGSAAIQKPSKINFAVVYREDTDEYVVGDISYAMNLIASVTPITVKMNDSAGGGVGTFVGAPDDVTYVKDYTPQSASHFTCYGLSGDNTANSPVRYKRFELVSQENPYTSSGYAWIIIEAQEG